MTFTPNIPFANNNPSTDQPLMEGNYNAINNWVVIDHIGFNNVGHSGKHLQVQFDTNPNYIAPPAAPTGNNSILYTQAGVASGNAQLLFQNSIITTLISCVRAFGNFVGVGATGPVTATNSFNVASIAAVVTVPTAIYTITLNPNTTSTDKATVLFFVSPFTTIVPNTLTYSLVSNVLTVTFGPGGFSNASLINFIVLQY